MGGEKHINKVPPKVPGQSREYFVYVFFLYVFFSLPKSFQKSQRHAKVISVVLGKRKAYTALLQ